MYFAYFPYYQFVHNDHTFCSKHVASALQHGAVDRLNGINPCLMTPSKLFKLFSTCNESLTNEPIVQVLPSKMFGDGTGSKCTASMVKALL
jgi:hypothetical protein